MKSTIPELPGWKTFVVSMQKLISAFSKKRIALIQKEELGSLFCRRSKTAVIFSPSLNNYFYNTGSEIKGIRVGEKKNQTNILL